MEDQEKVGLETDVTEAVLDGTGRLSKEYLPVSNWKTVSEF